MNSGIYIHIPFCKSRCSYCDFATDVYRSSDAVERYVNALISEISNFKFQSSDLRSKTHFDSIYFGGGTPSLLSANQLERILNVVFDKFTIDKDPEFTLEMNPGTVSPQKLSDFKSLGVNRASFGVQTFDDRALKLLARGHDSSDARETFRLLRTAGFENISFDLIGGLPQQTLKDWERNLDQALDLDPEHLSLYLLEIHAGTPLAEQIRTLRQPLPDEDLAAEMYESMIEIVGTRGFEQYEISNFAKTGFESRHNNKYWLCEPVYGFGVSAHSFDGTGMRWSNERDTSKYVELIGKDNSAIAKTVNLTQKQLSSEFAFLNLRLTKGLDIDEYKRRFGLDLADEYSEELLTLSEAGLLKFDKNRLFLTRKGRLYSNEVFEIFI
ncbi:MAG: radical SAM family heme chaperone HemW [Pyrinomonadaceae bacterium]